jgi:catechol 2,3-dioxygenase-like lactoylglutathione lyase family enzyme
LLPTATTDAQHRAPRKEENAMAPNVGAAPRRSRALAVHSLHRFVFSVPDLAPAAAFYRAFGLEVRAADARLDLYTYGHPHRWASIYAGGGFKKLEYLSFSAYPEDMDALAQALERRDVVTVGAHPLADEPGLWIVDPEGTPVQIVASDKATPAAKPAPETPDPVPPGTGAAPARSKAPAVRPRRLSHVLLFTTDVARSAAFYERTLGLRLSDRSGDLIAFMHGAHASDHHLIAFAKSDGPGLHHSSWDVASLDDVGLGMQQMIDRGFPEGWGVGRHVIGSNYFRYVRDPWGSYAEYSYDIDFIPADCDWKAADHPAEDSFYVWGPPVPAEFIVNHETAARRATGA